MPTRHARSVRFTWGLALLVAIAVATRAVFYVQERALPFLGHPVLDAAVYHRWASAWARGLPFGQGPFYQSPGYPAFLSLIYRMAGAHPVAGVMANVALGVGTVVLASLLGRRLFTPREGLLAGGLMLTVGPLYYFEAQLLSTTLAVFLGVLAVHAAMVVAASGHRGASWRRRVLGPLGAGAAAGALAVVRADLLPVGGAVAVAWGVGALRRRLPWRTPGLYLAGFLIPLLPVTAYNAAHGALVPVATSGGINVYIGNFRGATGVYENLPGTSGAIDRQEAEADSLVAADLGHPLPPAAESRYWFRRALREIEADPFRWGRLVSRKLLLVGGRGEETTGGSYALERGAVGVLRMAAFPFNLLFVLGVMGLKREERRITQGELAPRVARGELVPVGALLLTVVVVSIAFFFMTRLRLPAVPILAVLAAHALDRGWGAVERGEWRRVVWPTAVTIAFTAFTWNSPLGASRNPVWEAQLLTEASRAAEVDGEDARAARGYAMALEVDPLSLDALRAVGERALRAGDLPAAIDAMERGAAAAPDDFAVHNNLGILLYRAGRWEDCVATMDRATRLDPGAGSPYLYRGLALAELGRTEEAAASLAAALERAPSLTGGYAPLVRLLVDTGKIDEARAWGGKAAAAGVPLPQDLSRALVAPPR